jgi:hypothetical protein
VNLSGLNTPEIANAGVALAGTSAGVLGKMVLDLYGGAAPHPAAIALAFAGIVMGLLMAYVGRPSTLPPASK